jgi:hypothetical protein
VKVTKLILKSLKVEDARLLHGFLIYFWAVKIFCFIFSLYTLTLVLTPCADGFCAGDEQHQSSVAHAEEKAEDLCSSLCICACCGYTAVEVSLSSSRLVALIPASAKPSPFYKTPDIADFSIDFWQPPKLG